jgi:alkane 1-monooxygenase
LLRSYTWSLGLVALAWWFGSWREVVFSLGYALVSVCVVEAIGYLQHYGLADVSTDDKLIAWDVDYWLSNRLLANNGHHSSHHRIPTRPYHKLTSAPSSLPGGYIHMLLLAMLPKMWFRVMNKRAIQCSKR